MTKIFRQGDVLIVEVENVPDGTPISRDNGKIVLAYGESTGHAHAIADVEVQWIAAADSRFLMSDTPFVLRHEEHAAITIPAGAYEVIGQYEYVAPEIVRQVLD